MKLKYLHPLLAVLAALALLSACDKPTPAKPKVTPASSPTRSTPSPVVPSPAVQIPTPAETVQTLTVRPGAYCPQAQAGQHGTYGGADYVCTGADHPRWRKVS